MILRPLRDKIWVEKDVAPDMTEGGLVLPEVVRDTPVTGVVLAVGPGLPGPDGVVPMTCQVGDKVLFSKHAGTNCQVRGKDCFLINERDVLAVIESAS